MPTDSDAAGAARDEASRWMEIAAAARLDPADVVPAEAAVIGYFDPIADLTKRASDWNHALPDTSLDSLAKFAAGLASAEAIAWEKDDPSTATMAYEHRRFLLGDRILHWAVPWLDQTGRCYFDLREPMHAARNILLELGDRHRPAPIMLDGEGLTLPGEDSYGPITIDSDVDRWLRSIWSGILLTDATVRSMTGVRRSDRTTALSQIPNLRDYYSIASKRWEGFVGAHPGSARLWRDLARRAAATADRLS